MPLLAAQAWLGLSEWLPLQRMMGLRGGLGGQCVEALAEAAGDRLFAGSAAFASALRGGFDGVGALECLDLLGPFGNARSSA